MGNIDDEIENHSNIIEFKKPDTRFKNPVDGEFRAVSPMARNSEISAEYVNLLEDFLTDLLTFLVHRKVSATEDPAFVDSVILILTYHFLNRITPDGLQHTVLGMPSNNPEIGKHILSMQISHMNCTLYPAPFMHCTFATNDELVKDIFLGQCNYFFEEMKLDIHSEYQTIESRYDIRFSME